MMNIKELQENIEAARELLANIILTKKNLFDPEIVLMSEKLDSLLNEYIRLSNRTER